MNRPERLKRYLQELARHHEDGVEAVQPASVEQVVAGRREAVEEYALEATSFAPDYDEALVATVTAANRGLEKIKLDEDAGSLSPEELSGLEAIILPRERPAVDIVRGTFNVSHELWLDLNEPPFADRLTAAIPSIGRIGLPGQRRIPFAGTGFFVGDGLLMTNRHVAELFSQGLGRRITFKPGVQADIDFLRERDRPDQEVLQVRAVRMIHPYWDMALLEVEGQGARRSLRLSLEDVGDLDGRRVAVIGYPAYDPERNDIATQNQLFRSTYGIKRLQPGRLGPRRQTASFRKLVSAATHDCSTLGGNSGSAVIDLETGDVLALHFGGRYLETNYCVPAFELARDGRVVDAGVTFAATPAAGVPPWQDYWEGLEHMAEVDRADPGASTAGTSGSPASSAAASPGRQGDSGGGVMIDVPTRAGEVSITVPLTIRISLGLPSTAGAATEGAAFGIEEGLVEPWHEASYDERAGYRQDFLPGESVPLPEVADPSVVAPLLDGGDTLNYDHFSIQMHAGRRLALFTASNVTADPKLKKPDPTRDYGRKALTGLGPNDREKWFPDPRLAPQYQLSDRFYTNDSGAFDKGHIVRRDDVAWGRTYEEVRRANGDTYHVTNCSPQVAQYNQSQRGQDNWGDLENLVLGEAADERLCVFAGPILDPNDEIFAGRDTDGAPLRTRIPRAFWKVVVAKVEQGVAAYAFVLDQDLSGVDLEFVVSENFRRRMIAISELERRTGLRFPPIVRDNDQFDDDRGMEVAFRAGIERVAALEEAELPGDRPTPNSGDDEEAATETQGTATAAEFTEAPSSYRLAKALERLRAQVNAKAPSRSKASDGWIGDAAHRSRASDHNPWVTDGGTGVVTAIDVTHDPAGGCDAGKLAETLRAGADKRIKYIIWNKRIANREPTGGAAAWAWRPYGGRNPHDHHVHISVRPEKIYYDLTDPWTI